MRYFIYLNRGEDGEALYFEESLLDLIPDRVVNLMLVNIADDLGLCKLCDLDTYCHVMVETFPDSGAWKKLCPILFKDVFNPPWELDEIT